MIKISFIDNVIFCLTVALFSSFFIFEVKSWGKYIYIALALMIFLLGCIKSKGKIKRRLYPFHLFSILFCLYGYFTSIWAIDYVYTFARMGTVLQTLICIFCIYFYYCTLEDADKLISAVMWSGYIVSLYALAFYGIDNIRTIIAAGDRIANEFTNINGIGMLASTSLFITFSRYINKRSTWSLVFSLPALMMLVASGSRKAFLILLFGFFGVYYFKKIRTLTNPKKKIYKFVIVIAVCILTFIIVYSLPIFDSITSRMDLLFTQINGGAALDESSIRRAAYIELGFKQFKKTPILGIGIGNSLFLIGSNTYLHNNYLELLACGGLLGIFTYYIGQLYCLNYLLKGMKTYDETTTLVFLLLLLQLVLDYAQVSYFSKDAYFYFMIFFVQANAIKKCRRG